MKNPYHAPKHASLATLRALALQAFADHKQDMQACPAYRRLHLSRLAAARRLQSATLNTR